uniref:Fibrinogen C-terminal domain-containing protein n=1 Tax=Arion vulgaris TaxID=1028688 RepID=A0A0B6XYT7_9EUPU
MCRELKLLTVTSLLLQLILQVNGDLTFTMNRTPGGFYCGNLYCMMDVNPYYNTDIFSIVGLTIYDVKDTNVTVKLASLSAFSSEPDPQIEPSFIHALSATGSLSSKHSDLTLSLLDKNDCMYGTFLCEVDVVTVSGYADVKSVFVTPENTDNCGLIIGQFADLIEEITSDAESFDREFAEVQGDLSEVKCEISSLDAKLDSIIQYFHIYYEANNTACSTYRDHNIHTRCYIGMLNSYSREKFWLWGEKEALCDTETEGGGWVIFQRRTTGDVDFYRGWQDYKDGFGTCDTDYWLGLERIYRLTLKGYTHLRVEIEYNGIKYFAEYSNFRIADEMRKYKLTVSGHSGTAYDAFMSFHDGMEFSTYDRDNDANYYDNCAPSSHGAWWYNNCAYSNLNGAWGSQDYTGLMWYGIIYPGSVTFSEMKLRRE